MPDRAWLPACVIPHLLTKQTKDVIQYISREGYAKAPSQATSLARRSVQKHSHHPDSPRVAQLAQAVCTIDQGILLSGHDLLDASQHLFGLLQPEPKGFRRERASLERGHFLDMKRNSL